MTPLKTVAGPFRYAFLFLLGLALLASAPVLAQSGTAPALVTNGLGNFHQVNDHLYRGAQPSSEGFKNLAKLGVKTIIDLRGPGGRPFNEQKIVEAAGMRYVNIPFKGFGAPTAEQMSKVLALFDDISAGTVFVHCRRGADRTGMVIACYRVAHDHWANEKALIEARLNGMSWFERAMRQYVSAYRAPENLASAPPTGGAAASPDQDKTGKVQSAAVN